MSGRDLTQPLIKLAHRVRFSDQSPVGAQWRLQFLAQSAGLARQRDLFEALFENGAQLLRLEWLGEIIIGTELDGLNRGFDGCLAGHHDDSHLLHLFA